MCYGNPPKEVETLLLLAEFMQFNVICWLYGFFVQNCLQEILGMCKVRFGVVDLTHQWYDLGSDTHSP